MGCLVSIVVPVYNVEKYIEQCIESIMKQTYGNFELILVDDGSTDKSGIICDSFAKRDERILVFHNSNRGASASRNFGIEKAHGTHLCFVDSDDWVEKTYLSDMIVHNEYDYVLQGIKQKGKEYRYASKSFANNRDVFKEFVSNAKNHDKLFNGPVSKLFKTEIIKKNKVRFNEGLSLGEDLMFNLTYMCYIQNAYIADTCSYNYRVSEGSLTHVYIPVETLLNRANIIFNITYHISKEINNQEINDLIIAGQTEEIFRRCYRSKCDKRNRQIAYSFFKKHINMRNIKYMRMPYSKFRIFLHMPFDFADPILRILFNIMSMIKPARVYSNIGNN